MIFHVPATLLHKSLYLYIITTSKPIHSKSMQTQEEFVCVRAIFVDNILPEQLNSGAIAYVSVYLDTVSKVKNHTQHRNGKTIFALRRFRAFLLHILSKNGVNGWFFLNFFSSRFKLGRTISSRLMLIRPRSISGLIAFWIWMLFFMSVGWRQGPCNGWFVGRTNLLLRGF